MIAFDGRAAGQRASGKGITALVLDFHPNVAAWLRRVVEVESAPREPHERCQELAGGFGFETRDPTWLPPQLTCPLKTDPPSM